MSARSRAGLSPALVIAILLLPQAVGAGGGVVLRGDACIIEIGFYDASFTVYQPDTSGNEEFCEDLPDIGNSIFVMDYLHPSLREVPVDFRIIRDATELGRFVQHEDIVALQDIDEQTVFYEPPVVMPNASFRVEHTFTGKGDYIGIVTAGHPTNDNIYNAVFPFTVGKTSIPIWLIAVVVAGLLLALLRLAYVANRSK